MLDLALAARAALLGLLVARGVTLYLRHTDPARRVLVRQRLDPLLGLPGIAVAALRFFPDNPLRDAPLYAVTLPLGFSLGYVALRVTSDLSDRRRHKARQASLVYDTWYGILQSDPARATQFITAWFARRDSELSAPIDSGAALDAEQSELQLACAHLAREHTGDQQLVGALQLLAHRIQHLEQQRNLGRRTVPT